MSMNLQYNRPLKITTPLGPDLLLLSGLKGSEGLSQLFSFELDLLAERTVQVPFEKLLGQPVSIELAPAGGLRRYFHGLVRSLCQRGRDDTFVQYRAILAPQLWLWTKSTQSRIFQQKSVPEILTSVLTGLKVRFDLTGDYPARDYCVQYRESDFAFASRLMEEEGIYYFFEHTADAHEMIITDSALRLSDLEEPSAIVYDPLGGGTRSDLRVSGWEKTQEVCSNKWTLRDACFELPGQNLEADEPIQESVAAGMITHKLGPTVSTLERYDYPGGYARWFDGVEPGGGERSEDLQKIFTENHRTARLRMQAEAAQSLRIEGTGNCSHFLPGRKFTLMRHFDADGQYVLTRVEHQARLDAAYRSGEEPPKLSYENGFTCIPAELPYRPRQETPKPTIAGTQTATVVGTEGQEIFCDKYGRVKVQFPWDRQGQADARSSCWIRVAQVWAGKRFGAFFWPRVGQEVVVAFEEGDPDQPIVVGSVYNAANMPPFELPEKATAAGFKSCSVGGDPTENFNCLVFHDQKGDEHLYLHSENHECITSESSRFQRTAGPNIRVVGSLPFGVGSGSGGGMIEWPMAIGHFAGADFAEKFEALFPGSQTYVFGTQNTATMLGDSVSHVMGGASTTLVVDLEDMLFGRLLEHIPLGLGGLLGGAGGSSTMVCGANSTLNYSGPVLNVTRGESYEFKSETFWKDVTPAGIAVKLLALLVAGSALAGDLCAALMAKPKDEDDDEVEYPEWATMLSTGISSRFLALLIALEGKQAKAQAAANQATQAQDQLAQTNRITTQITDASDQVEALLQAAERRLQSAINAAADAAADSSAAALLAAQDAARTDKVLQGDYSLTSQNLSLISQSTAPLLGPTTLNISSQGGGGLANNGMLNLNASKQVLMQAGGGYVKTQCTVATSDVTVGNAMPGKIKLLQGLPDVGASVVLDGVEQSIKLAVGPPGVGASLQLGLDGITLQYALWSLKIDAAGIVASVGESSVNINPAAVMIQGLNVQQEATVAMLMKAVQVIEQISGILQQTSAMGNIE